MVKTINLIVQVFEKTISGQKVKGIVSWTKNTPIGPFSWTQGFCRVVDKQEKDYGH